MLKFFGNYNNTVSWFKEYINSIKGKDIITSLILSFKFPVVVYRDFKILTKSQKIISIISLLVIVGVIGGIDSKIEQINEQNILKCDCNLSRENDTYYYYWYKVGYDYGHEIPKIVNVEKSINSGNEYGKNYFNRQWIKSYININGSKNLGGIPNMKKYMECWEKGYLEGRNNLFDNK